MTFRSQVMGLLASAFAVVFLLADVPSIGAPVSDLVGVKTASVTSRMLAVGRMRTTAVRRIRASQACTSSNSTTAGCGSGSGSNSTSGNPGTPPPVSTGASGPVSTGASGPVSTGASGPVSTGAPPGSNNVANPTSSTSASIGGIGPTGPGGATTTAGGAPVLVQSLQCANTLSMDKRTRGDACTPTGVADKKPAVKVGPVVDPLDRRSL